MRTNNVLTVLALVASLTGCFQPTEPPGVSFASLEGETCGETVTSILAGRYLTAGSVVVTNDDTNLYVAVNANEAEGWAFTTLHLYAGTGEVPTNAAGTPVPGRFPYRAYFDSAITSYTFAVRLDALETACGEMLTVALHTESVRLDDDGNIVQTETGWGFGEPFEETSRWGWWFTYEPCCEPPPEEEGCTLTQGYWKTHHAFARGPREIDWPAPHDEEDMLCDAGWLEVLHRPPTGGDAWLILAHQYIAATLNVANGASTTPQVDAALLEAEAWLASTCEGAHASTAPEALDLAAVLDAYNNGDLGPGHCD